MMTSASYDFGAQTSPTMSSSSGSDSDSSGHDVSYRGSGKGRSTKRRVVRGKQDAVPSRQGGESIADTAIPSVGFELYNSTMKASSLSELNNAIKEWLKQYDADANTALIRLLNFIFQCCGARAEMLDDDVSLADVDIATHTNNVMSTMTSCANDGYLLVDKSRTASAAGKRFGTYFREFWQRFVTQCIASGLLDALDNPVETVLAWLTTISSADVRALRHTATVAASCAGLALIKDANDKADKLTNAELQAGSSTTSAKKKGADQAVSVLREGLEKLHQYLDNVFNGVFVHRFRDVSGIIRADVTEYLGVWVLEYPRLFLKNAYLKYIGWLLKDREAIVRTASLNAVSSLLRSAECAPEMHGLVTRFCDRLVEMSNDVDPTVAVLAYDVLTEVSQLKWLEGDIMTAEAGVFSERKDLRDAAAAFIVAHSNNSGVKLQLGSFVELTRRHLDAAAQSATDADLPLEGTGEEYVRGFDVVAYGSSIMALVADAFWDNDDAREVLEDWAGLCSLLLNDDGTSAQDDPEQYLLLSLLSSCGRLVAGYDMLSDKASAYPPEETSKSASSSTRRMTAQVAEHIPALLTKYQSDPQKVYHVLQLCLYVDVSVFDAPAYSRHCNDTIRTLFHVLATQTLPVVLESAAMALGRFRRHEFSRARDVELEVRKGLSTIAAKASTCLRGDGEASEVDLCLAMARLRYLVLSMDVANDCDDLTPRGALTASVFELLNDRKPTEGSAHGWDPQTVVNALDVVFHLYLWAFMGVQTVAMRANKSSSKGSKGSKKKTPKGDGSDGESEGKSGDEGGDDTASGLSTSLRAGVAGLLPLRDSVLRALEAYLSLADNPATSPQFVNAVRPFVFARLSDMGTLTTGRLQGTALHRLSHTLHPDSCVIMARCVDDALLHAEVKPTKSSGKEVPPSLTETEAKNEAARELSTLTLRAAAGVTYGFGFSELALPMLADLDLPNAAQAIRFIIKDMKTMNPEALCATLLDGLWKLQKLFADSDTERVKRIAKKLRGMLVTKGKQDKEMMLAMVRMVQRGLMDTFEDLKVNAEFLSVLSVYAEQLPDTVKDKLRVETFPKVMNSKLSRSDLESVRRALKATGAGVDHDDDETTWIDPVVAFWRVINPKKRVYGE